MERFTNVGDNTDIYENEMRSGAVAVPLGMTKAIGYKGKAKGKNTSNARIEEEDRASKPSRHVENR